MGLYIAGVDVSGDAGSFGQIGGGNSPLDMTGIDKFAMERQGGIRSGIVDFTAFHNPLRAHPLLNDLPVSDVPLLGRMGSTVGDEAFAMIGKQINYDPKHGTDGSLALSVNALSNGFGLQWGDLLTAGIRTDTVATNGPGFDTGIAGIASWQMYVHLLAFTGISVSITLQESDDGVGDPYSNILGVTTGPLSLAPATSRTSGTPPSFSQFIRVVTTGTFSNAQFVVMVATNDTPTVF